MPYREMGETAFCAKSLAGFFSEVGKNYRQRKEGGTQSGTHASGVHPSVVIDLGRHAGGVRTIKPFSYDRPYTSSKLARSNPPSLSPPHRDNRRTHDEMPADWS